MQQIDSGFTLKLKLKGDDKEFTLSKVGLST